MSAAYGGRASEYVDALGSVSGMEALDISLIQSWASGVDGDILDAGCGPGHWTDFLARHGHRVYGIDATPEFIESAASRFPGSDFSVMNIGDLEFSAGQFAGVLAWYSLIHAQPAEYPRLLSSLARVIRPGGSVLLGFFLGDRGKPFDHAVTRAYYVEVSAIKQLLEDAGFRVEEVHTRRTPRHRDHLAVVARRLTSRAAPAPDPASGTPLHD